MGYVRQKAGVDINRKQIKCPKHRLHTGAMPGQKGGHWTHMANAEREHITGVSSRARPGAPQRGLFRDRAFDAQRKQNLIHVITIRYDKIKLVKTNRTHRFIKHLHEP